MNSDKQIKLYDLYIANPIRELPHSATEIEFDFQLASERGYLRIGKAITECRAIAKQILKLSGNCYVIPLAYREVKVSQTDALEIARKKYNEYVAQGQQLGALDEGFDDHLWWTFVADDIEAQAADLIPGVVRISVDKLDGHFRTPEEYSQWLQLSTFQS